MTQGGYQGIIISLIKSKMAAAKKQCFLRFLYLGTVHFFVPGGGGAVATSKTPHKNT